MNTLHKHVTRAIERGEKQPIVGIPAAPQTDNQKIQAYLDWVNNFISTQGFADHYGITTDEAKTLIDQGRWLHTGNVMIVAHVKP